jgi:hypothetical protein
MQEKNRDILKKAIAQLPTYCMKDGAVWEGIAECLKHKEKILSRMPEYKAPEGIWDKIESRLPEEKLKEGKVEIIPIPFAGKVAIAAGILVIISLGIWQLTIRPHSGAEIIYSVEKMNSDVNYDATAKDDTENSLDNMISQHCKYNLQVCTSDKFINLQKELNNIDKEYGELRDQIMKSPDNQLYQYLYRIENERIAIQKEMLQLLNES